MKTTADFIDELKYKLKLRFDGEVAALFGWKSQQMSRYRTLESSFSDKTALRVAELLEIDPAYVIACMRAQSSTRPEVKTIWERIARKVAIVALGAFTGFLAAPSPADARASHNQNFGLSGPEYTLRRFRRGWWAAIAATLFGIAGCATSARARADTWLSATTVSYHLDRSQHFNETNLGLGVEHGLTENVAAVAGFYRNSLYRESVYAGVTWAPLKAGTVRAGVVAGAITGYMISPAPMLIPVVMLEGRHVGANILFLPHVIKDAPAVVALQLKVRF